MFMEGNMADDSKLLTISEEGCLRWNSRIRNVVYHKSLNVLIGFCPDGNDDGQIVVIDIASGTILHQARLGNLRANDFADDLTDKVAEQQGRSPPLAGQFRYLSIPERGTLVVGCDGLLGVRKDFGRALLLESMLQGPAAKEDDIVCVELPHNEAMLLRECLQTIDLSQTDPELGNQQTQVITLLTKHMKQYLFSVSKGSRMSSNWCIVTLELPLKTLKAVCTHAVLELKKNNRNIPALPIAASIVVRLTALQQQSLAKDENAGFLQSTGPGANNNAFGSSWETSSCPNLHPMTSEAARRETFASWPHMNYKWALPAQMAEAGFYHQPNTPESDRAVCFLCNVCLICWEPSDEPWSEHERHAPSCPLVKGDYTCNVPVSVVMATQPAVRLDDQEFACISTTVCPDLFATCSSAGAISLWNVNGPLKKEASFDASQMAVLPSSSRVTSLFVAGSPSQPTSRCSIAAGLSLEGQAPCLVIYEAVWRHRDHQPEAGVSMNGQATVKKGGTTKKVLPAVLTQNNTGSTGTSSESGPNQGLFFSFGDDPLEEDMYISASLDGGDKLGKTSGFLDKLMLNMGSPFTNVIPHHQQMLGDKSVGSSAGTSASSSSKSVPKVADQPDIVRVATVNLKPHGAVEGMFVSSLTPTWDANYLVAVLSSPEPECVVVVFKLKPDSMSIIEQPVCWARLPETPRSLVAIPSGDRIEDPDWTEEEARTSGPMRMAVVTTDGRLRLLLVNGDEHPPSVNLLSFEASAHRFVDVTFCSSVDRICACTDKGELVFFKISSSSPGKASRKGKDVPAKLIVQQNVNPETLKSVHQLTQAEKLPVNCQLTVSAASCWIEMAVTQRQKRTPHPWFVKPGSAAGEDGLQVPRMFKLQQDKFSWDEHFFEISLPAGVSIAHVHLRFVLSQSCPVPPEIQVTLLEQRSRSLQWGRSAGNEEVDNHINFNVLQTPGCRYSTGGVGSEINPITTTEYLDAHDAVLLCGPFKLNQFVDASGQTAVLTLTSHQLIQSTARNFLVHLKYIPSAGQPNSVSLLSIPKPMANPCGRRTVQTKGCDWIQEVAISVQRFKPASVPQERNQRCAILTSSGFTNRLLEYGLKSKSTREKVTVLSILNWMTAAHFGAPPAAICETSYDIAQHVVEIFNHLKELIELFVIRGNRTTAQQAVQLLISAHELGIQCLTEEEVAVLTKQLMHCLLQQLNHLHTCSSSSIVHWFSVLLARVYLRSDTEVAGPCWAVLTQIIAELHRRREPLQQLLQCRYGFYGRPFDTEPVFSMTEQLQAPGSKPVRSNIAASFAALNQLVNPVGPGDKDRSYNQLELLSLKRSCDLLDAEPLPFVMISSNDGVRLERAETGSSPFTAVALNGLVEAARLSDTQQPCGTGHRWQHLLSTGPSQVLVMERLHSGGRKAAIFDFGSPVILTDIFVPACVDWTTVTIDVWNRNEKTKTDTDFVRLATSSEINKRPLVLHDLQPPLICRFVRLTVSGRHGLNATNCKVPAGFFYGHTHLLPTDLLPAQLPDSAVILSRQEIEENIATLEVLADHSQCHYNLAADRLRGLLRPLLSQWHKDSPVQAAQHVDHYLQSLTSTAQSSVTSEEDAKIVEAYDECLKLQRQYNLLQGVMRRLQSCVDELDAKEAEAPRDPVTRASAHQLHFIAHSLVNVLLSATAKKQIRIERKTAEQLFQHLYVSCCPASQLSTAALLSQADDTYRWMPTFLADMLRRTLSSDASTSLIPKDRVFVTLLFMGFKAIQLSSGIHLLDPILAVLNEQLAALEKSETAGSLSQIDVPFVNWLLLFCCCCLDRTSTASSASKETGKTNDRRWDFMQGDAILSRDGGAGTEPKAGSGSAAASRIYRRKLQKKLMQQPHYGVSWPSGGVLSGSNKAKFIFAHSKPKGSPFGPSEQSVRRSIVPDDEPDVSEEKEAPVRNATGQPVCSSTGAARAAGSLVSLLLVLGASGSHQETFLLSCKVLARLVGASQSGLRLGHIADEKQLTTLLRLAACAARKPGQLWLNHAVYCLILGYLRICNKTSEPCNGAASQRAGSTYEDILRTVVSEPEPGSSGAAGPSAGTANLPSLLSLKPVAKMKVAGKKQTVVPPELLAYEQAKLAAESLKVDHHMEDLMELFENPNSDSVPPVLKKAWPSISSVMKNLAECKTNAASTNYGITTGVLGQEDSAASGVWDLRDESRIDGPWKQKADALSDAFFETVLQGLTSSFHDTKRRPLPEEVPGDPIAPPRRSDRHLLSAAFNAIFTTSGSWRSRGDVVASLKLWVLLNGDMCPAPGQSDPETADSGPILLSPDAIRSLLESLANIPVMDVGDWTAVLRGLAWLSSPRWLISEPDIASMDCDSPESSKGEELADQMCAGTLIRSPHLIRILFNFISGQGLVPFPMGEKQLVGPSVVNALNDVLSGLKVWCNTALVGSALGNRLRRSLLELFLELTASPHGPLARGVGPLDAQICFVEMLLKLGIQGLDTQLSVSIVSSIVTLTRVFLSRDGGLTCVDSSGQLWEDDRVCFHGLQTSSALSGLAMGSTSGRASVAAPSVLLSLSLQMAIRLVLVDEGDRLPDRLLSSQFLMEDLFEAADCCAASTIASGLGAAALADADFASSQLHTVADNALQLLHRIAVSVVDVELLFARLIEYVRKVVAAASSSAGAGSDLSEPLLIFILFILRSKENIDIFHRAGGFKEICLALTRSPAQLFDAHSRLVSNVLSYVSQTTASSLSSGRSKPGSRFPRSAGAVYSSGIGSTTSSSTTAPSHYVDATSLVPLALRRGTTRPDDEDDFGLLNLAPLSTITCGHPSAQPADVLLQPNPPHRRARSPSWSHHFYPAEQYIELTVTLPCPVLVKEIQLHPHLTSLATCPSAVGVEMSPEGTGQLRPVGPVLSATGLTTIAFKLEPAQVAGVVLLRLYKPRDSSNIGLAQIRILGSLALPASSDQTASSPPGLAWLCILHHCLSVAEKESPDLMKSLLDTAGSLTERPGVVEQCCGLLNAEYATSRAGMMADVVQMASDILLHLGRHSTELSGQFVRLQLHESPKTLVGCTPAAANVLYELCGAESSSGRTMLFEWLRRVADQSINGLNRPVSASMVHCASAVLWHTKQPPEDIVTFDLAKSLFEWAKTITNSELKIAVDYAVCSVCSHHPQLFDALVDLASSGASNSCDFISQKPVMETLARAAQSHAVLGHRFTTRLFDLVSQAIGEFCLSVLGDDEGGASAELVERATTALGFWTLLCDDWGCGPSRDFLACYLAEESLLELLLNALCHRPVPGVTRVEDAAVAFFRKFCWAHKANSARFAEILLRVLKPTAGSVSKLLTGFTRRLLLQLLLEPEKLYVHIWSCPSNTSLPASSSSLAPSVIVEPRHPQFGHGKKHKLLYLSSDTTLAELLRQLTDYPTAALPMLNNSDLKNGNKRSAADRVPEGAREADKKPKVSGSVQAMLDAQRRQLLAQVLKTHYYLTGPLLDAPLPLNWTLSQALNHRRQWEVKGELELVLVYDRDASSVPPSSLADKDAKPLTTVLDEFASLGGLAVLSKMLPMLLCASAGTTLPLDGISLPVKGGTSGLQSAHPAPASSNVNGVVADTIDSWVKLDAGSDDMDEEMDEILMPSGYFPPPTPQYVNSKRSKAAGHASPALYALPLHSLAAFSLFLSMPSYTEAVLQDRQRAQMLLRLALGVSDDGQGGNILSSSEAATFPILPFALLQQVLDGQPLDSEKGALIRQQAVDLGVLRLLLACLAVFTQQVNSATVTIPALNVQFVVGSSGSAESSSKPEVAQPNGESSNAQGNAILGILGAHPTFVQAQQQQQQQQQQTAQQQYWAKGTGFGTGSTAQTWDLDGAMMRQKQQEEQATCLLHALAAYIYPACPPAAFTEPGTAHAPSLPSELLDIIQSSHLVPAVCSYLRNDSVMDMARHVPLYKAILLMLRSIAACPRLHCLLLDSGPPSDSGSSKSSQSIHSLLKKLKNYVSGYTARLASVQNRASSSTQEDSDSEEGIADLAKDIRNTWTIVKAVVEQHTGADVTDGPDGKPTDGDGTSGPRSSTKLEEERSPDRVYCDVMQPLQFDSYEFLVECSDNQAGSRFTVAYHFENAVKQAGERSHPSRMKRLAQEVATLTTSLPLSLSSSVFVRCDTDRLDIMKVLITGPSDTPYANGCFEFDVYFPVDYPQSPMQVHLVTTGRHTVRFNPNLYNDGKVCLSVLNTWHGRPEEKWNPHTSSLLQVLVSIQSLILVAEPYFNEPGYERSRGTPSGNQNSRDYDVNIRQATVKWAMLEQIRNPSACFKQVTQAHFYLKKKEIEQQCEDWIAEMEKQIEKDPAGTRAVSVGLGALKRHYALLKEELVKLSPPPCIANSIHQSEEEGSKLIEIEEKGEECPSRSSPPPANDQFQPIAFEEDEDDDEDDASSQLLPKDSANDIDEMMFPSADTDMPLSWKEDLDDSETEMDNFVSQFTI